MSAHEGQLRVFMMDLWATVPYYTAYLSRALREEHIAVQVGSITYYLDPSCYSSRGLKVDPGCMDVVGRFDLPKTPRRLLKFAEAMLNLAALTARFSVSPPDVVHVQYLPMLKWRFPVERWFLTFCQNRGAKIVLTVHDLLPHDSGERYRATFSDLYARVDALICHSHAVKARLQNEFAVAAERITVIPHGPFFYDLPATGSEETVKDFSLEGCEQRVLWQGIIFPYKGIQLLLNAWQQVEAKSAGACLVVAGTGAPELLEKIRAQVAGLGVKRVRLHFRFISAVELVALYRLADVVVYPYSAITTSGALATGLALGKAIVASDLPVFRELLADGENALLVQPQESSELADALLRLLEDRALRERLAEKVQAMRFGDESWISIARQTAVVYERLCGCALRS